MLLEGTYVCSQLPIPKYKTEFSKKYFYPSTIKPWNELDDTIRDSVNKSSFKKELCSSKFNTTTRIFPRNIACSTQVTFTKIWVGYSNINHDLYCKGCTDNQYCHCGHIIENSKHVFLICPRYNNSRRDVLNEVQMHNQARTMLKWKSLSYWRGMHAHYYSCV